MADQRPDQRPDPRLDPRWGTLQRRSAARTAVVWNALQEVLDPLPRPASVVDIGGGTGGFAVRVAELGHRVVVVDPSPDALATLSRRAEESEVADLVTGLQGDLDTLSELPDLSGADVVLCYGVLEIVGDPAAALTGLAGVLRPGGTLSLLVSQRHAAVVTRAMAGHFSAAQALLEAPAPGSPGAAGPQRFTADEIGAMLVETGFDPVSTHAVRVFADLVPSSLLDLEPGAAQALLDLERAVSTRPEYLALATQLHTLATRR